MRSSQMKKVIKFEASDGSLHSSESEALNREKLVYAVNEALTLMGGRVLDQSFELGTGYIQLDAETVCKFENLFAELVAEHEPWIVEQFYKDKKPLPGYGLVGRCLDDAKSPLRELTFLRACIDENFKRWSLPYYTTKEHQETPWIREPFEEINKV